MSDQTVARTVKVFCAAYGVGYTTAYDLIRRGVLETRKAGRRTLITEASARAWFDSLSATHSPTYRPPPTTGGGQRRSAKEQIGNSQQHQRAMKADEGQRKV